jgi:hypothetical protein
MTGTKNCNKTALALSQSHCLFSAKEKGQSYGFVKSRGGFEADKIVECTKRAFQAFLNDFFCRRFMNSAWPK